MSDCTFRFGKDSRPRIPLSYIPVNENVILDGPGRRDLYEAWWPSVSESASIGVVLLAVDQQHIIAHPFKMLYVAPEERVIALDVDASVGSWRCPQMDLNGHAPHR